MTIAWQRYEQLRAAYAASGSTGEIAQSVIAHSPAARLLKSLGSAEPARLA